MGHLLSRHLLTLIWDIFSAESDLSRFNDMMWWKFTDILMLPCCQLIYDFSCIGTPVSVSISGNNDLHIWQNITSERNIIGHDHPEKKTKSKREKRNNLFQEGPKRGEHLFIPLKTNWCYMGH